MKNLVVLSLVFVIGFSLKLQEPPQDGLIMVGGYRDIDVNNLTNDQKDIDSYLKSNFPQLNSLKLTAGQVQVVSGQNYKYTYKDQTNNKTYEFIVWDQPWLPHRQIMSSKVVQTSTNSNGNEVTTTKTLIPNNGQYIEAAKALFK